MRIFFGASTKPLKNRLKRRNTFIFYAIYLPQMAVNTCNLYLRAGFNGFFQFIIKLVYRNSRSIFRRYCRQGMRYYRRCHPDAGEHSKQRSTTEYEKTFK